MDHKVITLASLPLGRTARVQLLNSTDKVRRRMLDLGLIQQTRVQALHVSPSGDPVAYSIRGAVIALRSEEAQQIMVELDD